MTCPVSLPKATPTPTISPHVFGRMMAARILRILLTHVPNFDLEAAEFAKFGIVNAKKEGTVSLNLDAVETVFIQGK